MGKFDSNHRISEVNSTKFITKSPKTGAKNQSMEIIHQSAYYVIGKFVDGYTSIVWHALNSEGEEVAIKMYEKNFDDRNNILSDDEFRETAKAATKLETERLKKIYNVLDGKAHNLSRAEWFQLRRDAVIHSSEKL